MGHWDSSNGRRQMPAPKAKEAAIHALQRVNSRLLGEISTLRKQRRSALMALAAFVSVHGEEDDGTAVYTLEKDAVSKLTGAEYVTIKGESGTIVISVRQATDAERQQANGPSRIIMPPGASVN